MKTGEKVIWGLSAMITVMALVAGYVVYNAPQREMPTYQVESVEAARGEMIYRENGCPACHKIWRLGGHKGGTLDGIGSRRDAAWLTAYLSTDNPQAIVPSEQKTFYQMPSFAAMSEPDRTDLVSYLTSLLSRTPEMNGDATGSQPDATGKGVAGG